MDSQHAPPSQPTTLVSRSSSATPTQTCDVAQRLAMIAEQSIDLLLSAAPPVRARVVRSSHDGSLS